VCTRDGVRGNFVQHFPCAAFFWFQATCNESFSKRTCNESFSKRTPCTKVRMNQSQHSQSASFLIARRARIHSTQTRQQRLPQS
jgi:hypothetical protein